MKTTETSNNHIINKHTDNPEPCIRTKFSPFWLKVFDYSFARMAKKAFFAMHVKNAANYDLRDPGSANIVYASHCSWWDGIVGYLICKKLFNTRLHMMIEELYRFPLLSRIGAFSVEKDSPQSAIRALNYSVEILQHPQNSIWIFPQGFVMPPDYRPIKFASGISYLCKKLERVNLIPIAHRYNFIREDRPEIFVEIGKPIIINQNFTNRKELTSRLEAEFTELMEKQRKDISSGNFEGYEAFFKERLCRVKQIENYFTKFVRSFNI